MGEVGGGEFAQERVLGEWLDAGPGGLVVGDWALESACGDLDAFVAVALDADALHVSRWGVGLARSEADCDETCGRELLEGVGGEFAPVGDGRTGKAANRLNK